jgi:hypothetical protein
MFLFITCDCRELMNAEFLCSILLKLRPNIFISVMVVHNPVVCFSVPNTVI